MDGGVEVRAVRVVDGEQYERDGTLKPGYCHWANYVPIKKETTMGYGMKKKGSKGKGGKTGC